MGTQVWWNPVNHESITEEILGDSYEHRYFLYGSVKKDGFLPLAFGTADRHEGQFSFGPQMREEFVIVRDKDLKQAFCLGPSGKLCGPTDVSELDWQMKFVFHGKTNTVAHVNFTISNGIATLRCNGKSF